MGNIIGTCREKIIAEEINCIRQQKSIIRQQNKEIKELQIKINELITLNEKLNFQNSKNYKTIDNILKTLEPLSLVNRILKNKELNSIFFSDEKEKEYLLKIFRYLNTLLNL